MNSIDSFLAQIIPYLTREQIKVDEPTLAHYGQDWSRTLTPNANAVLFPKSTEEVSHILRIANQCGQSIVPSGGRTGLSGGAVASKGEIVLSLEKLNFIGPLHNGAHTLKVGAGAITEAVHQFAAKENLTWPVDFASKGSSTVGGNLATNAGGVRVIKYGNTRNWVLGLTAVTMDGTIHHFNGELEKNNTGPDLRHLLIGSEGTLAVVTEATLKLTPLPTERLVFFFSLENFEAVITLFNWARQKVSGLSAFECLDRASLDSVLHHLGKAAPVKNLGSVFVLMEIESHLDYPLFTQAEKWLNEIFENALVLDGVMAQNEKEAQALWQYRETVAESILNGHDVHQEDVSVPIARLHEFYSEIESRYQSAYPEFKVFFFGHIGDGNLHIFIQRPNPLTVENEEEQKIKREAFFTKAKAADLELFEILKTYHGSISAEHGIGLLKKHAIHFSRSKEEIALLRLIKKAFDPKGLLNPGKVYPDEI